MPTYTYKARDAAGKAIRDTMEAAAKEELVDKLKKMGYMVTQVSEVQAGINVALFFDKFRPVRAEDMIMFYVQLANMISAGISILASLDGLGAQITNKKLKECVSSV